MECIKFHVTKISVNCMMHFFVQIARPRALVAVVVVHFGVRRKKQSAHTQLTNRRRNALIDVSMTTPFDQPSLFNEFVLSTRQGVNWNFYLLVRNYLQPYMDRGLGARNTCSVNEEFGTLPVQKKLGLIYVPAHSNLSCILGLHTVDINQWSLNVQPWSQ